MEGYIDRNTLTIGDFNTPFSGQGRSNGHKLSEEVEDLNTTISKVNLTGT